MCCCFRRRRRDDDGEREIDKVDSEKSRNRRKKSRVSHSFKIIFCFPLLKFSIFIKVYIYFLVFLLTKIEHSLFFLSFFLLWNVEIFIEFDVFEDRKMRIFRFFLSLFLFIYLFSILKSMKRTKERKFLSWLLLLNWMFKKQRKKLVARNREIDKIFLFTKEKKEKEREREWKKRNIFMYIIFRCAFLSISLSFFCCWISWIPLYSFFFSFYNNFKYALLMLSWVEWGWGWS